MASGAKPFEVRIFDRDFRVGDSLFLREWDGEYTGRDCYKDVTYVLTDDRFCKEGYCILGLKS